MIPLALMMGRFASAQEPECTCTDHMRWLIETFEANDAGFQWVIDRKGREAYEAHNRRFLERAAAVTSPEECTKLLNEWTHFFRKRHIGVLRNGSSVSTADTLAIDDAAFRERIQSAEVDEWEGIWRVGSYLIGIVKDTASSDRAYVGFIIQSEIPGWRPHQIKLEIVPQADGGYMMRYYLAPHSPETFPDVKVEPGGYVIADWLVLKKTVPAAPGPSDPPLRLFVEAMSASEPFIQRLSNNTLYLRIPSFSFAAKQAIDSVLRRHHADLTRTEHLIIDLRNNGGGADISYQSLLPYLYTNPIRTVGVAFLSTELNNQRMEAFMKAPHVPEAVKAWARQGLEKLRRHPGEFVNLDDERVTVERFDSVLPYPRRVAILINQKCASTTEQFLLAAKQSWKVKLFGTSTGGALDFSNLHSVTSPCGEYTLWYALSRSERLPDMAIDGHGIQPDFYLDRTIPPEQWVPHVQEVLNGR